MSDYENPRESAQLGSSEIDLAKSLKYSVAILLPWGATDELVLKVQSAVLKALNRDDDPPPVIMVQREDDEPLPLPPEQPAGGEGATTLAGWVPFIPPVVKVAKEVIDYMAREARYQQRAEHRAQSEVQREATRYHERAERWREKTFG